MTDVTDGRAMVEDEGILESLEFEEGREDQERMKDPVRRQESRSIFGRSSLAWFVLGRRSK